MSKWGRLGILICLIISTQTWASIGQVSLLKGEAAASRDNQTIKLITNSSIEKLDKIITGNNSQIQLTFEDKTVITLGSSSVLDIQEYLNDAQQPKAKFKFSQGTFKSITGEIGKKAPENFNLETKTATIGIRGTTVAGSAGYENGQNYVSLLPDADGSVGQIAITTGGGTQILNQAGPLPLQLSSSFAPPPPPPVRPDLIGCYSGAIVVTNPHGSVPVSAGSFTIVSPNFPPSPPTLLTPTQIQQLNQPPSAQSQGSSSQSQATTQAPAVTVAPPITPTVAEQASQTNQQASISTGFTDQLDNYSDGFHPVFNPSLRAASKNDGVITLSGFATSSYISDETTITSARDTLALNLDTSNDSITGSTIVLNPGEMQTIISLDKAADSSTMTYKNLNRFAIKDFDNQVGWMQTENTYANDYVSWGYWAMKINDDSTLLPTTNYWVAGKDATAANNHITSLIGNTDTPTTSYTYNGHVIGSVSDGSNSYSINPTTNNEVKLNFDFGRGNGSLANTSYIKFQTSQVTPQSWQITPSGCVGSGSFSIYTGASVAINNVLNGDGYSTIKGQFYGSSAQAVGGTFNATSGSNTATGVFKAVR